MISRAAIPALVGELLSGVSEQVAWAVWPLEVYSNGCLVRLRLVPEGSRREYEDFRTLAATVQPLGGLDRERIVLEAELGELRHVWSLLPNRGGERPTDEPWEHAWTVEYWWPRDQWSGNTLTLTWPVRSLRVIFPVDRDGMAAVPATMPPGSDDL